MIGGGFLLLAAILVQFVREAPAATIEQLEEVVADEGMLPTMTPPETPGV